jgi:GNAT superfamily N-acetyltransferase
MTGMKIRVGGPEDIPVVLALLDRASEWLVAQGRTDQWGTEPHSTNPRRIGQITGFATSGGLWIAELAGRPVGALAVGEALPHVPPATEPELYVRLLVTDRETKGSGVGSALLVLARSLAKEQGVGLLRLDCFAGGDGALVRYYERQGFTRAETFTERAGASEWQGQILVQRL